MISLSAFFLSFVPVSSVLLSINFFRLLFFIIVVVFQSLVGVSSSAGVIKRTKSGSGWNAGAVSQRAMKSATDTVRGISAVCDRNDKYQMIGLNSKSTSSSYSDIDFAMYCARGGILHVYEKGSYKGKLGTYSAGATIQVVVNDQGKVEYLRNGER